MNPSIAADHPTWGVPGPTFNALFIVLIMLAVLVAYGWRRALVRGPSLHSAGAFSPAQVALLNDGKGRRLAVYGSLAALRTAGCVDVDGDRRLRQVAALAADASELDRAVYAAAGGGADPNGAVADAGVAEVLDRAEAELVAAGWLIGGGRARAVTAVSMLPFAVGVLGAVRVVVAGLVNGEQVGFLVLLVVAAAVAGHAFVEVSRSSGNARRLLARMRADEHHLAPRQAPSLVTYGPRAAALAVGLFGAAALWTAYPAFAAAVRVPRRAGDASATGSDGGCSSGCSAPSSCGGDSCGGGSCGGGGGD